MTFVRNQETPSATLAALDRLLETHTDEDAAQELNRRGYRNWKGERYTAKRVRGTRLEYGLPSYLERERERLRSRGFRIAEEVAAQLGVKPGTIRERARENMSQGLEREIIETGGRRYCMYRLRNGGERPRIPARSCGGTRNQPTTPHRRNKVQHETRDLSRGRRTRAGSTATP